MGPIGVLGIVMMAAAIISILIKENNKVKGQEKS